MGRRKKKKMERVHNRGGGNVGGGGGVSITWGSLVDNDAWGMMWWSVHAIIAASHHSLGYDCRLNERHLSCRFRLG